MVRRVIDFKKQTEEFNTLRMQNLGKSYSREELIDLLKTVLISENITGEMISRGYLNKEKMGHNTYLYEFTKTPVNIQQMESLYKKSRKSSQEFRSRKIAGSTQDPIVAAINLLKAHGYRVQKPAGFDVEAFKKKCPDIYEKYLTMEDV